MKARSLIEGYRELKRVLTIKFPYVHYLLEYTDNDYDTFVHFHFGQALGDNSRIYWNMFFEPHFPEVEFYGQGRGRMLTFYHKDDLYKMARFFEEIEF